MRPSIRFLAPVLVTLAVACSTGAPEPSDDLGDLARRSDAIINGVVDTTHPAVVALILAQGSQGGLCSGTIVKVDAQKHIGWVATAAHCVELPPALVVQAQNFSSADAIRYAVLDYEKDERYTSTGGSYDFAMVRIVGVDADTPVIPLTTSPDGLSNGTPVTSVGFGRTSLSPPFDNSERRVVNKTLDDISATLIGYDMSTKGICQGDSGGPVLVGSGSTTRVVGIHSFVQGDCDGRGYSGRVTAGLQFFAQQLAKPLPSESCGLCEKIANSGKNECTVLSASCLADPECKGYYQCLSEKSQAACLAEYPLAEGPFNAAANCVCTRACADQCGSSVACLKAPKCGFEMKAGDCATCIESSCCQEETDCAADGQCYVCLKTDDADAKCATNAARKKLATCAANKCKTECADSPIQTGADDPPAEEDAPAAAGGKPPTTTTKTTGCSTSAVGSGPSPLALIAGVALLAARRRRRR
jgi:MYXO-CTERM domain-containing protein